MGGGRGGGALCSAAFGDAVVVVAVVVPASIARLAFPSLANIIVLLHAHDCSAHLTMSRFFLQAH